MLAIDFETYLISPEHPAPKPVCISWYDGKNSGLVIGMDNMEKFLSTALKHPLIVAHNMKFESTVIHAWFPRLRPLLDEAFDNERLMCSKVNETLLTCVRDPNRSKEEIAAKRSLSLSLAALVLSYFGEDISESKKDPNAWRLRYSELEGVDPWPQEAIDYAISDSVWSYKLAEIQMSGLEGFDMFAPVRAEHYLNVMANYGILVDKDRVLLLEKELKEKILPAQLFLVEKGLMRHVGGEFKTNTSKLTTFVAKAVEKDALKLNKSGKVSITKSAVKKYLNFCKTEEARKILDAFHKNVYEGILDADIEETLKNANIRVRVNEGFSKNSKEMQAYLKENVPKDILKVTAKRFISTKKEDLELYCAGGDEALKGLMKIMEYEKVLSAFVSNLKTANPLIRTEYNGIVKTGRTSSHGSKIYPSVNIQQMPRAVEGVTYDVRNCYVPRPGYKICSIDYSGLELASCASQLYKYFGESNMRDTINAGEEPTDMHSVLAARIMSMQEKREVTYEEFVANKKQGKYKELRQISKQVNLGFPGGLGYSTTRSLLYKDGIRTKYVILNSSPYERVILTDVKRFQAEEPNLRCERTGFREYSLVYDELVSLKAELIALYPELGIFLKEEHEKFKTGEKRRMMNDFGEWEWQEMYSYDIGGFKRDFCTYTEFCNGFLMQSPSAKGAKLALANAVRKYDGTGKVNCLAFIHDEIVFEVKEGPEMLDLVEDMAYIMIDSMQEVLKGVRVSVEADVMDYWKKSGGFYVKSFFKDPIDTGKTTRRNMVGARA